MKKTILATGVLVALLAAVFYVAGGTDPVITPAAGVVETTAGGAGLVRVTIPVEGMTCSACAAGVKSTLERLDGVQHVEVDLAKREARVQTVAGGITPERLAGAITELGYQAGTPVAERGS